MSMDLILAPLLALGGSCCFAFGLHFQKIGLRDASPRFGVLIVVTTSAVVFWLFSPFFLNTDYFFTQAFLIFAVIGLIRPALSTTLAATGLKYLGPSLTSGLAGTTPIFSALLAFVILGETLSWGIAIGTAAVVFGLFFTAWRPGGVSQDWPFWAIFLPLSAAFIRSSGHAFTKFGFAEVPSPYFAMLISTTVSAAVLSASFAVSGESATKFKAHHWWFVLAGLSTTLAVTLTNFALFLGELVRLQPIMASTPVWTILISYFIFKNETLTPRTIGTVLIILSGVLCVILFG